MVRSVWTRLGHPHAISWVTAAVVIALQTSGSILTSLVDFTDRFGPFLAVRLVSLAALCAVLLLGKWALLRWARETPRPLITLITFVTALAVGTVVFDTLLVAAEFTDEHVFWRRFSIAAFGVITAMVISAVLVGSARDVTRDNLVLSETVHQLAETRLHAAQRIADRHDQLLTAIDAEIHRAAGPVHDAAAPVTSAQMRTLLDDVVRPLSYQLSRSIDSHEIVIPATPSARIPWRAASQRALTTMPLHPIATPVWLSVISASFFVLSYGWRGFLAIAALLCASAALTAVTRAGWARLPASLSTVSRAVLFPIALVPLWLSSATLLDTMTGFPMREPTLLTAWAVICTVVASTVALVTSLNAMQRETSDALNSAVGELRREIVSLNTAYRQLQKGIARVLHGPVQEAVSAALHRLGSAPTGTLDPALGVDLRRRIASALELLRTPDTATRDLGAMMGELSELWSDVVDIRLRVSPADQEVLTRSPSATTSLSDLIREACGNAIRHGRARAITVQVSRSRAERVIQLRVENDGAPLARSTTAGVGTQLFDELCVDWSREQVGDRVVLRASIPFAPP